MHFPLVALGGAAAMAAVMGVGRFAYTPILPAMHAEASLSAANAGFLATLNFAGYLLATLWPLLAHRLGAVPGPKTMLRFGLATCFAATLAMGLTESLALWGMLRFVSGFASALSMIYATTMVLDALARSNRSGAAAIHFSGVGFGISVSGLMVLLFEQLQVGWRGMWFGAAAVIALLVPVALMTVARRTPRAAATAAPASVSAPVPTSVSAPRQAVVARGRNPWWLVAAYACAGLGFIISGTFLPLIAKETPATAPYAAFCWVIVGMAAIPSNVLWAWVARRAGATASLVVQYALQAVAVVLPIFWQTPLALLVGGLLLGGTFMGIVTVASARARDIAPQRTAEMLALMTACYSVGQIIGPPMAGLIATQTGSFDGGLAIAAGTMVLGIFLLLMDRASAPATSEIDRKPLAP